MRFPRPFGTPSIEPRTARSSRSSLRSIAETEPREQIFYGEFDGRRDKRVLVKIIGE